MLVVSFMERKTREKFQLDLEKKRYYRLEGTDSVAASPWERRWVLFLGGFLWKKGFGF